MQVYKRKAQDKLQQWYKSPERQPLILIGARQVGKTTLVNTFAKQNTIPYYYINLEDPDTREQYSQLRTARDILRQLQVTYKAPIPKNALIFFDEVQNVPHIVQQLRFFKEEFPQYAVIASGSWLNLYLQKFVKDKHFSFPVGRVTFMTLLPFTFLEYLYNSNKAAYDELTNTRPKDLAPLHSFFITEFHKYMVLGGMPSVLKACKLDICPLLEKTQKQLLSTFIEDISKYIPKESDIAVKLFRTIYSQPARAIKKTKIVPGADIRVINKLLAALSHALLITQVKRTYSTKLPLIPSPKNATKYLALDIGLALNSAKLPENLIPFLNNTQQFYRILEDSQKGNITEQVVGQLLLATFFDPYLPHTDELYYWQNKDGKAEIDFVLPYKGRLIGIEVKSGRVGKLRSLIEFLNRTPYSVGVRIYNGPFRVEKISFTSKSIISIPFYMVELLPKILEDTAF